MTDRELQFKRRYWEAIECGYEPHEARLVASQKEQPPVALPLPWYLWPLLPWLALYG